MDEIQASPPPVVFLQATNYLMHKDILRTRGHHTTTEKSATGGLLGGGGPWASSDLWGPSTTQHPNSLAPLVSTSSAKILSTPLHTCHPHLPTTYHVSIPRGFEKACSVVTLHFAPSQFSGYLQKDPLHLTARTNKIQHQIPSNFGYH